MEAKDTVMSEKKIQLLGQQYEDDLPTYDLNHYLLLAQAKITWDKAYKAGEKVGKSSLLTEKQLSEHDDMVFKAGQESTLKKRLERPDREKIARIIAESHGYVFPCGIEEDDDSFRYWADRILLEIPDEEELRQEDKGVE